MTTKKKTKVQEYVGVNECGGVFLSEGPVQLLDGECIWLSKEPNQWTMDVCDVTYPVDYIDELDDDEYDAGLWPLCLTKEEFEKEFPGFLKSTESKTKKTIGRTQLPLCC